MRSLSGLCACCAPSQECFPISPSAKVLPAFKASFQVLLASPNSCLPLKSPPRGLDSEALTSVCCYLEQGYELLLLAWMEFTEASAHSLHLLSYLHGPLDHWLPTQKEPYHLTSLNLCWLLLAADSWLTPSIPGFSKLFRLGPLLQPALSACVGQMAPFCRAPCLTLLPWLHLGAPCPKLLFPFVVSNKIHLSGSLASFSSCNTCSGSFLHQYSVI